jgi:hypothetical protein
VLQKSKVSGTRKQQVSIFQSTPTLSIFRDSLTPLFLIELVIPDLEMDAEEDVSRQISAPPQMQQKVK